MTEISAISSERSLTRWRRKSKSITPSELTGMYTTSAASCSCSHCAGSIRAECSIDEITTTFLPLFQNKPLIAALSASVPDPVKMISEARQSTAFAITSRASSTSLRTERPSVCKLEGLPSFERDVVIALSAASAIGVVAAWSRYTLIGLKGLVLTGVSLVERTQLG